MKKSKMIMIALRFPPEMLSQLNLLAEATEVPRARLIRKAVAKLLRSKYARE